MKYPNNFGDFIFDVLSKSTGVRSALVRTKTHVLSISIILAIALLTVIRYLLPNFWLGYRVCNLSYGKTEPVSVILGFLDINIQ